ncbi:MAG: lipoyl synthase [Spirochaetales bacterium]|nr:lipoyl synthase [Spirochaetales bacterium]
MRIHHPEWFKITLPHDKIFYSIKTGIKRSGLHTVCEEAGCPNRIRCFSLKRVTFLILGKVCTRNCLYCGVTKGTPDIVDKNEPVRIAGFVRDMKLDYLVITSVTRDDLADKGAGQFAAVIAEVKKERPGCRIEVLTPDFSGDMSLLKTVLSAKPFVFAHNIEVVKEFYPRLRPGGRYSLSLELLAQAKEMNAITKSGIMIGLGETINQIKATLKDLKHAHVDVITIGQYLPPGKEAPAVRKYYTPQEFNSLKVKAQSMGFRQVCAGPLVRSSYCQVEVTE